MCCSALLPLPWWLLLKLRQWVWMEWNFSRKSAWGCLSSHQRSCLESIATEWVNLIVFPWAHVLCLSRSLWMASHALRCVTLLGVICKVAEGALDPFIYVIDDIKQNWSQYRRTPEGPHLSLIPIWTLSYWSLPWLWPLNPTPYSG